MPNLSPTAKELVNLIRRSHLTYGTFRNLCHEARAYLKSKGELLPPKSGRKLPKTLTDAQLKAYMMAVSDGANLQHEIMIKLFLFTGIRASELCGIKLVDIDLAACKIFITGKGDKERYVLFADSFRSLLRAYLATTHDQTYLFESKQHNTRYTRRRIHQIVVGYMDAAKMEVKVHPHVFRHQMITFLKLSGMDDSQVQVISGHANRKSLEIYDHTSLVDVKEGYQQAMKKMELP